MKRQGASISQVYLAGKGPFEERLALIALTMKFLWGFASLVETWAQWVEGEVAGWPEAPAGWPARTDVFAEPLPPNH
jgi:hypothetical protein